MKKFTSLMLILTMLMTGCSSNEPTTSTSPSSQSSQVEEAPQSTPKTPAETTTSDTITVVDHDGVESVLPSELNRIAVLNPTPLPALVSLFLGSSDSIVGINSTALSAAKSGIIGELFPDILDVDTSVYDGSAINIEKLLELEPDVVMISAGAGELRETIENVGIPVVAFGVSNWDYNIVDNFSNWVDLLCQMYPANENVLKVTPYSEEIISLVTERVSTIPEDEVKDIFFLFNYDENAIRTSGNFFFGQFWSETVGAKNVAGDIDAGSVEITMEQVYAFDPDIIYITNFTTATPESLYTNTVGDNDWSLVEAVQNKQVYKMPNASFRTYSVSAEMPVVLLWMAQQTYPELFEDIDVVEEMINFYDMAFGIQLTNEQANAMFYSGE